MEQNQPTFQEQYNKVVEAYYKNTLIHFIVTSVLWEISYLQNVIGIF